jgi:hypothetical protein
MADFDLEILHEQSSEYGAAAVTRVAVPGGWIYTYTVITANTQAAVSSVFVPDPEQQQTILERGLADIERVLRTWMGQDRQR